ncbi:phage tail protein [Burkholderia stagnalis]|uniref:phage tail protein n=1 Tax=Burkholderia stagnalis TaxID=1503054 RepID=UPI00075F17C9|nr:phage tail protein [Burkholderia stagnalis]KWI28414.1 phage tail protein [Burkholderia stagnalis]KWI71001.1 phage tail protein [Burkholderia stagnalis]MDY7806684.1 phage tail protein [Burkholderia stagnalis]
MKNTGSQLREPSLSHRFKATFFIKRVPSPLDMNFAQISGLGRTLNVEELREGGDNVGAVRVPSKLNAGTLTLQRGVIPVTPATLLFNQVLSNFTSTYVNVVILLLSATGSPVCSWTLADALPIRWTTGDLDASSNAVLIDTLELAYREMHWVGTRG